MKLFRFLPVVFLPWVLFADGRFPQPQFDAGHTVPQAVHPAFVECVPPWADAFILAVALAVAVWLVRVVRSRRWILAFAWVCLGWFGFVRQGCICPVGSVQNVAVAVCRGGGLPWFVAALFALPLLAALLFGRVFCAAVCPLGVLQDLFIVRPLRVPKALDAVLRVVPLIVLSLGVVCALNGAGYLICRTDPFVGFFRRSAPLTLVLSGLAVLLLGLVVARPYCRYFCPYGVLLELCSRLAWKPVALTERVCVNCRLCVGTCPVDAIAVPQRPQSDTARQRQFKRFLLLLALAPLLIAGWCGAGWFSGAFVAKAHPDVVLSLSLAQAKPENEDLFPEIEVFKRTGKARAWADEQARVTVRRFRAGCAGAGLFVGLVLAFRLLGLTRLRRCSLHEADRVRCVACGRCFAACPKNAGGRDEP